MRIPPGRAGRLWLQQRHANAERTVALLRRKQRLLGAERDRHRPELDARRAAWEDAWSDAHRWMARATTEAGRLALEQIAARIPPASVGVHRQVIMGVELAIDASVTMAPGSGGAAALGGSVAYDAAAEAAAKAVAAAAAYAATLAAVEALDAEIAMTRRRLRLLERHRIPALAAALRERLQQLDDAEREDIVRVQTAAAFSRAGSRATPSASSTRVTR